MDADPIEEQPLRPTQPSVASHNSGSGLSFRGQFGRLMSAVKHRFPSLHSLAPRGSTPLILFYTTIYGFVSAFYPAYSSSYTNTAAHSLRHYLNESYVLRGHPAGLSPVEETWLWSFILNANFLGGFIGIPFVPLLADRMGRRPTQLIGISLQLTANSLDSLAMALYWPELYVGSRVLGNGANALVWGALILVVIESAPTPLRGLCTFILGTCWTAGVVVGMVLGMDVVLGEDLPMLAGAGIVPALLAFAMSWGVKETPKFILLSSPAISDQSKARAEESLFFYQGLHPGPETEKAIAEIFKEARGSGGIDRSFFGKLKDLLGQRHLRRAVLLGCATLQLTAGVWPTTTELLAVHFGQDTAQMLTSALMMVNFVAGIVGAVIIHRVSRRWLLIGSGLANMCSLLAYVACDRLAVLLSAPQFSWLCLAAMLVYNVSFGIGFGTIAFYLSSELLPQTYRSFGQSLAFFVSLVVIFAFNFLILPAYEAWDVWVFVPAFAMPQVACLCYLWRRLPETRNREIHEIVEELMRD